MEKPFTVSGSLIKMYVIEIYRENILNGTYRKCFITIFFMM